jgi:hypothetical protein
LSTGVQPNDGNEPVIGKSFFALGQAAQLIKYRKANILRQNGMPALTEEQADALLKLFEPKATKLDVVIQKVPDSPEKPFRVKTVNILG